MIKKEMIAMLLAGGQGSRLGVLTAKVAKPAVSFGGKYRIIDFPLSNCINSGVDTVGVLTQYQPLRLNTHIGLGGISMSGLAIIRLKEGFTVSGSDNKESELTEELRKEGATVYIGQRADNISSDIDLVVYSAASRKYHP